MSTQPLPVHLLDGPAAGLQALGRFPLAHYLRPLHLNVLPLLLGQAVSMARETAPRSAPSPGSGLSVPCRTRFWSAPERSAWVTRSGWVVSQTRVCDTGPQFTPFSLSRCGAQRYSAVRTSWRESDARDLRLRPHQPPQSLRAGGQRPGNPTPAVAGCRRGAFSHLSGRRRLRNLRGPTADGAGTLWTPGWLKTTPWLWCPSTASGGAGWIPWATSTICNGAESGFAAWPITNSPGPSTWMPTPIRRSRSWAILWPASPPGCPTRNWCPSAAVPRLVWRRRRRTARNWELLAGCPRSRRPRSSRWSAAESASGASPGPSAYRLRRSGAP